MRVAVVLLVLIETVLFTSTVVHEGLGQALPGLGAFAMGFVAGFWLPGDHSW